VEEAIATLGGEGPADLLEVTLALAVEMLLLAGTAPDASSARATLTEAIASGAALEKLRSLVVAQGGDPAVVDDPSVLPQAAEVAVYTAPRGGVVCSIEPRTIGRAIVAMGGGRRTMEDAIDHTVGFVITAKPGDQVKRGEPLASIYARDAASLELGGEALGRAITIGDDRRPAPLPLVSHRVTDEGVEELADVR
jgi:thymidine phosphorylase